MALSRQATTVRDYLRENPHLTSWQAEGVFRIRRLASRIDELRADGYEIVKETRWDASGQRYTRYSFSPRQRISDEPLLPKRTRNPNRNGLDITDVLDLYRRYCREELGIRESDSCLDDEVDEFATFLRRVVSEN